MHDFKHTVLRLHHLTSFSDKVNLFCTVAHLVQHICNALRMRVVLFNGGKIIKGKINFF